MVPVELKLSNFLSYGAEPQTLDFSQFHVACLSGKNGQGKSALLDAITWVLWGEARKSSGGHKPDEELLRIGARRMQVELVFDVESVRYRVMRAYSRSATGKTSKAEMELQVLDTGTEEGRPITQASIRESQNYLNDILGLDYRTFINSAFLLQGRSDEFTKKKPNERKEILGRILNLEKYDRLAAMARERQRRLSDEMDVLKREIDRLILALEPEANWKEASKALADELKEKQDQFSNVRQKEAELVERLGGIDVQIKAAESIVATLNRLAEQKAIQENEKVQLDQKILNARQLVERADEIEAHYAQLNALVEERESLESSRELYRGVERLLDQKKNDLQQHQMELKQRIHQLELECKVNAEALEENKQRVGNKEKYQADLEEARAAKIRVDQEKQNRSAIDHIKQQIAGLENTVVGRRESVLGQLSSLQERHARLDHVDKDREILMQQQASCESDSRRLALLNQELEEITNKGQGWAERIKSLEGEIAALTREQDKVAAQMRQLKDVSTSRCPTCGSELTEGHRDEVASQLREQLNDLASKIRGNEEEIKECGSERDAMREAYKVKKDEAKTLEGTSGELAKIRERIKTFAAQSEERTALEAQIAGLKTRIDDRSYASEEYARLESLGHKLAQLRPANDTFEQDSFKANQIVRYEEHLRNILHAEGRRESLLTQIELQKQQVANLRVKIDEGDQVKAFRTEIVDLEGRLKSVGFDPVRFEAVRQEIKLLDNAHSTFKDLMNARQNLSEWQGQQKRISEHLGHLEKEIREQTAKREALKEVLQVKDMLEAELKDIQFNREESEKALQILQVQSGEMSARLEQAKQNRSQLKEHRKTIKDVRAEEGIYRKLRRAFSKQGIPSLIIEQSLPEIEERANLLLDQLADGKMRVNLETLKDKKTGGTRETLEIIITDEQGVPRPYETFSGGEAFRVNFALRIALSQMLAERNGVRIRTLGIDEGFGTQDEDGIQNLIEALQVIQEDFDKILVITHLDRLKEAFPVRIEVEKHPAEGSRFTLFQN